MAASAPRRRKALGQRRRVEDEAEDDGPDQLDANDDDSLTEGSIASDENERADDSDTSNIDEASPVSPNVKKATGNGAVKSGPRKRTDSVDVGSASTKTAQATVTDTEAMLNGLSISKEATTGAEIDFEDANQLTTKAPAPIVVSSSTAPQQSKRETVYDRNRREHELYRQKRDEDPAFVPNRGAFFMHDHRGAGPSANGFRPFNRGGRARGRGGMASPFPPFHQLHIPTDSDPQSKKWTHDMHEAVVGPMGPLGPRQLARQGHDPEGPPNGNGIIPTRPSNPDPINRTMSTQRTIGQARARVFFVGMKDEVFFSLLSVQYTKLPDHRPPLRRDKPVRISLPNRPPRYVFPAIDRSFIFIPRAMRPNQQRLRGKPRSGLGSVSGFSRRTSVFGGSYYGGSMYSPSVALSRRSSIAPDMGIISPTGSAISRPPLPGETSRPVVRLPPTRAEQAVPAPVNLPGPSAAGPTERQHTAGESSINNLPQPQTHPLPQKPTFPEKEKAAPAIQHPRPQKAVSIETIESPTSMMPFHQQVPVQVASGFTPDTHNRHPSYPSHTTGTPLSQIPERAIHAAPFQPHAYPQQGFYGQGYPMVPPQQQGYYYPQPYDPSAMAGAGNAPAFVPQAQQPPAPTFSQAPQSSASGTTQANAQAATAPSLVAQEANGMVYYYDASQIPAATGYPPQYPTSQGFVPGMVGMGGMANPSADGYYYQQHTPSMMYYPQ